jgi:hypothetical protein
VCDDAGTAPAATVRIGQKVGVGALDGDVAVVGICGAVWSDGQFETLMTSLADWVTLMGADPAVLWAFDQADVSIPVVDVLGGGGDQTAISGTTVTTDPPGFSYALGTPVTATLSGISPATLGALSVTASSSCALAGVATAAVATLAATTTPAPSGGSWETLLDIAREAARYRAEDRAAPPSACPRDGTVLTTVPRGDGRHCRFCGYLWPRDGA